MKKILIFAIVVGAIWFIWQNFFSGSDVEAAEGDEPAEVVESFFKAFKNKDAATMVACLGNSHGEPLGELESEDNLNSFNSFFSRSEFKLISRAKVEIKNSRIDGDHAIVPVEYMNGTNNIPLVKSAEDGKWRIDTGGNLLEMLLDLKYDAPEIPSVNFNL